MITLSDALWYLSIVCHELGCFRFFILTFRTIFSSAYLKTMGRRLSFNRISTTPTRGPMFTGLKRKMAIVNPFRKNSKDKTPNKKAKTTPSKRSPRFTFFASSTPNSGQKEQRKVWKICAQIPRFVTLRSYIN